MKTDGIDLIEGSNVINLAVEVSGVFPSVPNQGEIFFLDDALNGGLHIYRNLVWERIAQDNEVATVEHDHEGVYIDSGSAGTAFGVATLGADSKIPQSQLPSIAITNTFVVADQTAMLAVTAQTGDIAVRTDTNVTYVLSGTVASTLGDWTLLPTPTDAVLSVGGVTGAVSASDLITAVNTVDGTGSGLDADKWDGGDKTISTSAPSGGANGDVWFTYIA